MKPMRLAVMAVAAVAGFSARASIASALDCTELSFTTGGAANWVEQTTDKKVGTSAMRSGAISDSTNTWLQATVTGSGMVSFWWKVSSESGWDVLTVSVDDAEKAEISGDHGWAQKSIAVRGEGEHAVKWVYSKDSGDSDGADCGWLDGVSWTPAPEKMRITLVMNGAGTNEVHEVAPWTKYSDLPVPERDDELEFSGWYLDEGLTEKVLSNDYVAFRDQTLYAKWELHVSVLNADGLEFSTDYDSEYYLPWEVVAEAGASGGYAVRGIIDPGYKGGYLYLWTTNRSGTLSYKWKAEGNLEVASFNEYNDQDESHYYFPNADENWQTRTVRFYGDGESEIKMNWRSASSGAALVLSDFVWTPAPESMVVTFVTNGGDEIAPTNVAPGVRYGELPVPQKEGSEVFDGWYLDEDLTEKVSRNALVEFHDQTLYAKWRLSVSLLDADGLEFSTVEDSAYNLPWEAVAEAGASGGYAVRGPTDPNQAEGRLYLRTYGIGTLTYKWRIDGNDNAGWFWEYNDEDGSYRYFYGYESGKDWKTRTLCLYGDDERVTELEWCSSSRNASLMLSDFVWTPAPETITVSFNANGGTVSGAEPRQYSPSETYGRGGEEKLPTPVRKGYTFLGWREESMSGKKVSETDRVPLREAVTLVAKWGGPLSVLNSKILTKFTSSGDDKWYAVDEPCMPTVAEVEPKGRVVARKSGSLCDDDTLYKSMDPTISVLQTPIAVEGYLSFRWSLKNGGTTESGYGSWPFAAITFYLDGKKVESEEVWKADQETGSRQVNLFIPAGKHTLKWEVKGCGAYYRSQHWYYNEEEERVQVEVEEFGSAPVVRVWDFEFEKGAPQPDLQTWTGKVRKYESWRTGDLARFAAVYKARMIADKDDYEARILYAATRLGALAENAQFKAYAKTFGMTIDWAHLSVTPPSPKFDKNSAAVNAMVDKTIELATPVIKEAQAALAGIPEDWDGSVAFDPEEWPIDETMAVDIADVLFARAGLDAALAGLNFLGAYDLTVNWPKVAAAQKIETKIPVVAKLPAIGDADGWAKSTQNFRTETIADDSKGRGVGAMAISGNTLSLRLASPFEDGWLNETNRISYLGFLVKSDGLELRVGCEFDYGGSAKTNVDCWVYNTKSEDEEDVKATVAIRENEFVLNVDLKTLNFGTKKKPVGFSKKSWSLGGGHVEIGSSAAMSGSACEPGSGSGWTDRGFIFWENPGDGKRRVMKFLNDQTALFSKVRNAARLSASRRQFKAALERALEADGKVTARPEDGTMHFIEYDPEDKAAIDFARDNTHRALQCLEAPTVIDFAQVAADLDATGVATNKFRASDYNYTLLPDEGMTRVYLGALFEGRITRALMPPMRMNIYGEIVPDFDAMPDPTIGGMIPDMTAEHIAALSGRFGEERELDHGEQPDLEALPKPGEKVTLTYADYKGYAASGLPKGWTWNKNTGVLTGTAASTFTVTFTKKGKPTAKETIAVGAKPAVLLFSDNEEAVAVTGTGLYNVGATVKVVAAVRSGSAFGGWYDADGNLVFKGAVYSFKMPRTDVALEARTVPLADDGLYAKPAPEYELPVGEAVGELTPYTVLSVSPATVTVSGLPPGLTYRVDEGIEDDRFKLETYVTGKPTKAGIFYVLFTAKNSGGFRNISVVKFTVGGTEEDEPNTAGINWDTYADGEDVAFNAWDNLMTGVRFGAILDVPSSSAGSAPTAVVATKTVKKKKTSTLPPGLSATFKNGRITLSGVPSTPGKFTMEFTVTYKNKKTAKAVKTVVVQDRGSVYIPTGVFDSDPKSAVRGTATGGGVKHYGQTLKFVAAPANKKNLFFAGWYLAPDLEGIRADVALPGTDYRAATLSAVLTDDWSGGCDGMYARFVTKAEETSDGIVINCDDDWRVYDVETGLATSLNVAVGSDTKATLSAKGLPAGTALSGMRLVVNKPAKLVPGDYTATLTAKTAAGNVATKTVSVLVPNTTTAKDKELINGLLTDDTGYAYSDYSTEWSCMQAGIKDVSFTLEDLGVTVAEGWTLAVSGLPTGWTYNPTTRTFGGTATKAGRTFVTFTVSRKTGKKVESYKATAIFDLGALPATVSGTFVGPTVSKKVANQTDEEGTRIPGEDGMATLTVSEGGKLSASVVIAGTKYAFTGKGFDVNANIYTAKLSGKVGKKAVTLDCAIRYGGALYEEFEDEFGEYGSASLVGMLAANKRLETLEEGLTQNVWTRPDCEEWLPVFAEGLQKTFRLNDAGDTLTLKFGAKGVVTCAHKTAKGVNTGTATLAKVSRESTRSWTARVVVGLAPKAVKSGRKTVTLPGLYVVTTPFRFTAPGDGDPVNAVESALTETDAAALFPEGGTLFGYDDFGGFLSPMYLSE